MAHKRDYKPEDIAFPNQVITESELVGEMEDSYRDYAMSVIVGRALPDVRDGLKPVHRRILYAMYEDNLTSDKPFKKSATCVGDVLGRYHPHGDASVYDAMVRLAQDFSMRYMLVDGHGNFGSVDGDPPAAYRYTEARLARLADEMTRDIEKIRLTLEETSKTDFSNAVSAIERCNTIYILGARSAEPLAKFLNYYFSLMFPHVKQLRNTTTSELFEQLMRIDDKDVIIGISFPRYSRQTAQMLEYAKAHGAHVIAVTDSEASPLAPFANDLLIARSDMNSFADSLVAPLSLINALIAAVSISNTEKVRKSFEKLEKIWEEYEVYSNK